MKKTTTNLNNIKKHLANVDNKNACKNDIKRVELDVKFCDKIFPLIYDEFVENHDVPASEVIAEIDRELADYEEKAKDERYHVDDFTIALCKWIRARLKDE